MSFVAEHGNALPPAYALEEYRLLSVLGEGGFGITYRAEDTHLSCQVAIKEFLPTQLAKRSDDGSVVSLSAQYMPSFNEWKRRFLQEARVLARFRHRSIVRVLRFFEANCTAYIVMEFEQGMTLEQRLGLLQRPMMQAEIDVILAPLLDGLEEVHRGGFLHRDLKPHNIIIRGDGSPVLIDFGAARLDTGSQSRTLTSIYTPGYAAPEQYAEHGRLGPWTDIYALGGVLYRAVCGGKPADALHRLTHANEPLPPAAAARGDYRASFLAAIDAALVLDPEQRPQSVGEWRQALMADAPPPAEPPPEDVTRLAPPPAWPPEPPPARRRPIAWIGGAAVLAVLLAAGALLLRGGGEPAPQPVASPALTPPAATAPAHPPPATAKATAEAPMEAPPPTPPAPPQPFRDCPDCPEMVVLPAGGFVMGSPAGEPGRRDSEEPQHTVTFAEPFAIGRHPVTRKQFAAFAEETNFKGSGCFVYRKTSWLLELKMSWRAPSFEQGDDHPVVCVSWEDAQAYAEWLSRKTGQSYRLPTEAEWEYAARGGIDTARYWGDEPQCAAANAADAAVKAVHPKLAAETCNDRFPHTAPVGSFPPNPFELHDMLGNVAQWTEDCWHPNYAGAPEDGSAWPAAKCTQRVVRGAAWSDQPNTLRAAFRDAVAPTHRDAAVGFRLVTTAGR